MRGGEEEEGKKEGSEAGRQTDRQKDQRENEMRNKMSRKKKGFGKNDAEREIPHTIQTCCSLL